MADVPGHPVRPGGNRRVIVVSGIGPGLGRQIAIALAQDGADLVLAARTQSRLDAVADEARALGAVAITHVTDITRPDQCTALSERTIDTFGRIDGLVNNAYQPDVFQLFEEVDLAVWRQLAEVNLFGPLQLTQAVVPHMKQQGHGSIVFVNSSIIRKPVPLQGGYAVAKGGLETAARILACELGRYGIRVNSVVPGWMWGPPLRAYFDSRSAATGRPVEDLYREIASHTALDRIATDAECAEAVVFLASERSRAATGLSLDVNAGEVYH
jgi:NAD(P)-dependent dehydrogenase (short-subunit alcohol dehydrogenase family)